MEVCVRNLSTTHKDTINLELYLYPIENSNKPLLILK